MKVRWRNTSTASLPCRPTSPSPISLANLKYPIGNSSLPDQNNNPTTIRVDHRITPRDNFYAKANWNTQTSSFLGTSSLSVLSTGASTGVPTTNNAANVSYLQMQGWGGALGETPLSLPPFRRDAAEQGLAHFQAPSTARPTSSRTGPRCSAYRIPIRRSAGPIIQGVGTNFATYIEGDNRRALSDGIMTAQQNYTWIKNNHTIQFGWTYHDEV